MNRIQEILPERLAELYRGYGYMPYTMSKFEEYELYLRNKDFLISDRVLTFTDTNGKLMALKPDVTLSIIKNTRPSDSPIQKLYYQETVYRPGKSEQGFREIMQIGLECMGNVDDFCVLEVLMLAVKSLHAISEQCVLDISHMGLLTEMLDRSGLEGYPRTRALEAIAGKNAHELRSVCEEQGIDASDLMTLTDLYGTPEDTLPVLRKLFPESSTLASLERILNALQKAGCGDSVHLDFSVVNNRKYYNGILFRGFVEGVPEGVLSGGEYDGLMERMHRKEKAIGFALYPDLLERLEPSKATPKPDCTLLYPQNAPLDVVTEAVATLTAKQLHVSAQPMIGKIPGGVVYVLEGNEVKLLENNA